MEKTTKMASGLVLFIIWLLITTVFGYSFVISLFRNDQEGSLTYSYITLAFFGLVVILSKTFIESAENESLKKYWNYFLKGSLAGMHMGLIIGAVVKFIRNSSWNWILIAYLIVVMVIFVSYCIVCYRNTKQRTYKVINFKHPDGDPEFVPESTSTNADSAIVLFSKSKEELE